MTQDCNTRWWISVRYSQACVAFLKDKTQRNREDMERWKMMLDQHDKSCMDCKDAAK